MDEKLTRNELAAWVQVAFGAVGTIASVLASIPTLKGVASSTTGALPVGFAGGIALLQIFGVLLILTVSVAFVATGFGFLLGRLFERTKAHSPFHGAFCVVIATILAAAGLTLAMVGLPFWIWFALQTVLSIILAGLAQVSADRDRVVFWTIGIIGSGLVFAASAIVVATVTTPTSSIAVGRSDHASEASGSS